MANCVTLAPVMPNNPSETPSIQMPETPRDRTSSRGGEADDATGDPARKLVLQLKETRATARLRHREAKAQRKSHLAEAKALKEQHRNALIAAKSRHESVAESQKGKIRSLKEKHRATLAKRTQDEAARVDALKKRHRNQAERLRDDSARIAAIRRILDFARGCRDRAEELRADVFIAHDVMPLAAVHMLADRLGGRRLCNAVEIPSFAHRVLQSSWPSDVLSVIDAASEGYLARCDTLLTTGAALAAELERYGRPIHIIENFRYRETLKPSTILRERCGLAPGDRLLLSIGHLASGLDPLMKAVAMLPANVHFASLGQFIPSAYEHEMRALTTTLGIADRVHFLPPVPYAELTSTASAADCGLVVNAASAKNNVVSFPNRVFDFTSASLPIIAPDLPDISLFLREFGHGQIIADPSAENWASSIRSILSNVEDMKSKALEAATRATWEGREPILFEAVGDARTVTFLGVGNLAANNRTLRMARSLAERGIRIKICSWTYPEPPSPEHENITFHTMKA